VLALWTTAFIFTRFLFRSPPKPKILQQRCKEPFVFLGHLVNPMFILERVFAKCVEIMPNHSRRARPPRVDKVHNIDECALQVLLALRVAWGYADLIT
jgi:hypothetical protein